MKHLIYTGNFTINGAIQNDKHDLPSLDSVLQQWAEETNYKGSLSELKVNTLSSSELTYANQHINHLTDVTYELLDMLETCEQTDTLLIIKKYPAFDLKVELPISIQEILNQHFHVIDNHKQQFKPKEKFKMKHILHTGNIIFGADNYTVQSLTPHVTAVLEQWAQETGYAGSIFDLPVMTISAPELVYFETGERHNGQAMDEFMNLIEETQISGTLLIVTTYPSVDFGKELGHEYEQVFNEHFHIINNWNKQTAK